uniref:Uncharacterized protein n=1 Tax=Chenopodium quinoa TaxID=63459 RepID=A0A803N0X6_CHEQI
MCLWWLGFARKNKQATPTPSKVSKEITESLFVPAPSGFQAVHEVFNEGDELVTPAPGLVHPSAGLITRRDAEMLALSFGSIGPKTNGTVTSPITVPLPSNQAANPGLQSHSNGPFGNESENIRKGSAGNLGFAGKLNAKGISLNFVPPPKIKDAGHICEEPKVIQDQNAPKAQTQKKTWVQKGRQGTGIHDKPTGNWDTVKRKGKENAAANDSVVLITNQFNVLPVDEVPRPS